MKQKETLLLFINMFIKDNLKHGFTSEHLNNYVDKFLESTKKSNINKLNKLIDEFENVVAELSDYPRDIEFDKSHRKYRFRQFLFDHDELKNAIKERKVWLNKKRLGVRNYMR